MFYKIVYSVVRIIFAVIYPTRFAGRENMPEGAALVCANHTDNLDAIFAAFSMGVLANPAYLGKKELFSNKFAAGVFTRLGIIPIERGSADVAAIKKCFGALKSGRKLVIFPEGTRHADGEISDAKSGAGMFALRTGVPVVPVYIPSKKRMFRISTVIIGEPYTPANAGERGSEAYLAAAEEIMDKIRALKTVYEQKQLQGN